MNALLTDLRAALPPGVDVVEVLAAYVADHPRDREALGLLLDAAAGEEVRDERAR